MFVIALIISTISVIASDNNTRENVLRTLFDGYDPKLTPAFFQDGPVNDEVQIYISSIASISESTMDYSMTMFLRQRWIDTRLKYDPIPGVSSLELDTKALADVWIPDLFIVNEKKANFHDVTTPNKLMHIYSNGKIFYSLRLSGTFSCKMNLLKYPMDYQVCLFVMESYGQSTELLEIVWNAVPVQRQENLTLPEFLLGDIETFQCDKAYVGITYTCIGMNIHLSRSYGYHLIQIYIPSALIVCLSWVSFWLNIDATPARISLGLLTVLTMTTQSSGARANLPKVSYIKAIDVWMAMCLFFVFAALIEFAWVNVLARVQQRRQTTYLHEIQNGTPKRRSRSSSTHTDCSDTNKETCCFCFETSTDRDKARLVDKGARILFPLAFVAFNLAYWCIYLLWEPVDSKV
ncbi:glycine receptor subunit alpha-3-like isoform X2 [Mytilus californianus]|uniref:glycine receptor subunit alpha-3-like isoform X2 n=1 Tax=Mytilus californianus TaxID=6549 RepID=UPI0022479E4D|nr:glycine receptor subunit alpha-3-like isoform X2 [Mytilus californianus]XP_052076217.1 glycine receptor subunit alpha-3-like isoform X2 [Mytilus californianus]